MRFFKSFLAAIFFCLLPFHANATSVNHDARAIKINDTRKIIISGSIHYLRSTAEMWPDLIRKAKQGGLDTVETYVFWNVHESVRGQYDFSGNRDLVRFIKTIQAEGLHSILRIGPYVCAEWNYGGFPLWLHKLPGVKALRTYNKVYMNEMQNFTTLIVNMMKNEKLFASQGGPIILAQIENEYGNYNIMDKYGAAGQSYIRWAANMANSLNIGVPWIMCQQKNAPKPMLETCNGFYCDDYQPSDPNTPKMWTENWTGWFKKWGNAEPYRSAEDLAFSVARFFQRGGTLTNYYMYHGGTNFGRTAGGPYVTTSYDYNAPLAEYGNLNQPKWGHLKQLHDVLHSMEYVLTHGDVKHNNINNNYIWSSVYSTKENSSCFLSNTNDKADATVTFRGMKYFVPAWSVSILPDCKVEAYNTAKVNAQTSFYDYKIDEEDDVSLEWEWRAENIDAATVQAKGEVSGNWLADQKDMAVDASDYLWYITSVNLPENDSLVTGKATLIVDNNAVIIHAYVNGKYAGSKLDKDYNALHQDIKLQPGNNIIALLSVTTGFGNYGYQYDLAGVGIWGAQLVAHKDNKKSVINLSSHKWTYKVGLEGIKNKFYNDTESNWSTEGLPTNTKLTWYKTNFNAPLGNEPVVVDLIGLGKGTAWVNGNSLGRYWPSSIGYGPCKGCDYRGPFKEDKCVGKCGQPTQRWYHVPRSFLNECDNTLVLLEEFGGNPGKVKFQTVEIGKACVNAYAGNKVELSCNNRPISRIAFASFGNPKGGCGSFTKGGCESVANVTSIIEKECVGKQSCSFDVSEDKFGKASCDLKRLAVEAIC